METLDARGARRLALARSGLMNPAWTDLPRRAATQGRRARRAVHRIIDRFGYLQLDTVAVAGARSHCLVPLSRLEGLDARLPETLLEPGEPLFEYWGHEVSWMPLELYPHFAFRRRAFRTHPWWGDLLSAHADLARQIKSRIRDEGPLRSLDLEGEGSSGFWNFKIAKKIANALWSAGELSIRERRNFQRTYDLAENVIDRELLEAEVPFEEALAVLLLRALDGHGWASRGTLAATWRLTNLGSEINQALERLTGSGDVVHCALVTPDGRRQAGFIRPADLELAMRLRRARPRRDLGVLLSPFDPLLWDRRRVATLFGFEQVLEIFKPAEQRIYGYYCLPVLAGDRLVARCDLKADARAGTLAIRSLHFEADHGAVPSADRAAADSAIRRHAEALELRPL